MRIESAALSDCGKIRDSNEDSFIADSENAVFIVADGMGGHAAGETAGRMAALTAAEILLNPNPRLCPEEQLLEAVKQANARVYETQYSNPACRGMGSTLTALIFRGGNYHLAHVGDSRAYMLRDGKLEQLSRDHSHVWQLYKSGEITKEEISRHPRKNLITRCIGMSPEIEADFARGPALENDIYLLCSDGLTDILTDGDIQRILTDSGRRPEKACELLVYAANAGGGPDNITAVVVSLLPVQVISGQKNPP
ncbi:MAG: Stp1/IreP family PP2C-type Ser/Thr phosphatase [Acidobacteriota bacterium]|nr:Stp1/IreP family PP2C-type Ser/Thr phosphatase [Acidobacteriota bacterium]